MVGLDNPSTIFFKAYKKPQQVIAVYVKDILQNIPYSKEGDFLTYTSLEGEAKVGITDVLLISKNKGDIWHNNFRYFINNYESLSNTENLGFKKLITLKHNSERDFNMLVCKDVIINNTQIPKYFMISKPKTKTLCILNDSYNVVTNFGIQEGNSGDYLVDNSYILNKNIFDLDWEVAL